MAAKAGIKPEVSMAGGKLEQFSGCFRAGSGENQETGVAGVAEFKSLPGQIKCPVVDKA